MAPYRRQEGKRKVPSPSSPVINILEPVGGWPHVCAPVFSFLSVFFNV